MTGKQSQPLRIYYDGSCSVCRRFCRVIDRSERSARIEQVDFTAADFDAESEGLDRAALEQGLHARLPDGRVVRDFDAILAVWTALDRRVLAFLGRLPVLHTCMSIGYRFFAKHRHLFV